MEKIGGFEIQPVLPENPALLSLLPARSRKNLYHNICLNCVVEVSQNEGFVLFAASTARHLYLRGGAGVGSMTKIYGGRQRNGVMPSHFSRGSKSVARRVLQALEGLKMVEKDQDG